MFIIVSLAHCRWTSFPGISRFSRYFQTCLVNACRFLFTYTCVFTNVISTCRGVPRRGYFWVVGRFLIRSLWGCLWETFVFWIDRGGLGTSPGCCGWRYQLWVWSGRAYTCRVNRRFPWSLGVFWRYGGSWDRFIHGSCRRWRSSRWINGIWRGASCWIWGLCYSRRAFPFFWNWWRFNGNFVLAGWQLFGISLLRWLTPVGKFRKKWKRHGVVSLRKMKFCQSIFLN